MLFLRQAVQGLLTSSFSIPNVAFSRDVLLWGDGFGNCETCRSVIVHAEGAWRAPAQKAQLIAVDKDKKESIWFPKQPVGMRQGAASWQSLWNDLLLSLQHH